jgi:hypothetical protein
VCALLRGYARDMQVPSLVSVRTRNALERVVLVSSWLVAGCSQEPAPAKTPAGSTKPAEPAKTTAGATKPAEPAKPTKPAEPGEPSKTATADTLPTLGATCSAPGPGEITVPLGQPEDVLARLFPVRSTLPDPYGAPGEKSRVPETLDASIRTFVTSSLARDGFTAITVTPTLGKEPSVSIAATGCNLADYQTQLPKFLAAGVVGSKAWDACVADGVCKANVKAHRCASSSEECPPWAFFLPLGLPLANHWSVMLLDYPPSDALCGADYLGNFTMSRWAEVYAWQGVDATAFEALVDVHPIAAAGSGESSAIDETTAAFADYRQAMLAVLATPPNLATRPGVDYSGRTLPVLVSGSPAQAAWGSVLGSKVKTGDTGVTEALVPGVKTAWIASNHPDVTTYQCCAKDPDCASKEYGNSWDLVADETLDFTEACWVRGAAARPQDPFALQGACKTLVESMGADVCTQARLDYDYDSDGSCNCTTAAEGFCSGHAMNACPNGSEGPYLDCTRENEAAGCPTAPPSSWFSCAPVGSK